MQCTAEGRSTRGICSSPRALDRLHGSSGDCGNQAVQNLSNSRQLSDLSDQWRPDHRRLLFGSLQIAACPSHQLQLSQLSQCVTVSAFFIRPLFPGTSFAPISLKDAAGNQQTSSMLKCSKAIFRLYIWSPSIFQELYYPPQACTPLCSRLASAQISSILSNGADRASTFMKKVHLSIPRIRGVRQYRLTRSNALGANPAGYTCFA